MSQNRTGGPCEQRLERHGRPSFDAGLLTPPKQRTEGLPFPRRQETFGQTEWNDAEPITWIGRRRKAKPASLDEMRATIAEYNRMARRDSGVLLNAGIFPVERKAASAAE